MIRLAPKNACSSLSDYIAGCARTLLFWYFMVEHIRVGLNEPSQGILAAIENSEKTAGRNGFSRWISKSPQTSCLFHTDRYIPLRFLRYTFTFEIRFIMQFHWLPAAYTFKAAISSKIETNIINTAASTATSLVLKINFFLSHVQFCSYFVAFLERLIHGWFHAPLARSPELAQHRKLSRKPISGRTQQRHFNFKPNDRRES